MRPSPTVHDRAVVAGVEVPQDALAGLVDLGQPRRNDLDRRQQGFIFGRDDLGWILHCARPLCRMADDADGVASFICLYRNAAKTPLET